MENRPAEIFGYPVSDTTAEARKSREKYWCPFIEKTCDRTSRAVDYPFGVCTILQDGMFYVICPHRFDGKGNIGGFPSVLENVALHHFGELKNLAIISDIKLPNHSTVDFVIVRHKPFMSEVDDFVPVELCASLPTGTAQLIQGLNDVMSNEDISTKLYRVSIDNTRTIKRFLNQVFSMGIVYENWGVKSYWVIQEYIYADLGERYGLEQNGYSEEHACRFALQSYSFDGSHVRLQMPRYVSENVDEIYQAMRNDPTLPSKDRFVAIINNKFKAMLSGSLQKRVLNF